MSTTTPFGYKIPEVGDLAQSWMQDLTDNWIRISDHNHNGVNSRNLSITAITKLTTDILAVQWGAGDGFGNFTQLITVPGAIEEIDEFDIFFVDVATGDRLYPDVTSVSATTFNVTVNDNSLNITATYL